MQTKDVLCDSSSLISLTDSGLESTLYFLHQKFNSRFIIPPSVEYECITRPLDNHVKQYAFSALKIKKALNDKVLTKIDSDVESLANEVLRLTNTMLYVRGKPLKLVHLGEAEMIALAKELGVTNILIDERTTRMLIEAPFRIKEHLEQEFGVNILLNSENLRKFSEIVKGMQAIRSSELLIISYENNYLDSFGDLKKDALAAALHKLKFSGCSIRFDEIEAYIHSIY
ncbi:hypothetical protein HYT84_02425 [Candidatus Micrarchaeota archaeon]|nr:hypothetical protein [Candidatus Micrarchaeota archaeon]